MNMTPIAADDQFTATQGQFTTTITGNLGTDNGNGADFDPDGSLLGFAGLGFTTQGDGDRYLGAFFSNGVLGFLSIEGTVSYPFPVFSTTLLLTTVEGGHVTLRHGMRQVEVIRSFGRRQRNRALESREGLGRLPEPHERLTQIVKGLRIVRLQHERPFVRRACRRKIAGVERRLADADRID